MARNPSRDLAQRQYELERLQRKRAKCERALEEAEAAVAAKQAEVDAYDGMDMTAAAGGASATAAGQDAS